MKQVMPYVVASVLTAGAVFLAAPALQTYAARKAKAVIDGPSYVQGGPVLLKGERSTGSNFTWECSCPFVVVGTEGQDCVLQCPKEGSYTATLLVKSGGVKYSESKATFYVQVGGTPPVPPGPGPGPKPPVPPNPGPTPGPVPDGRFGLTKATYDAVTAHVPAGPSRAKLAHATAALLKDVAQQVKDGKVKGVVAMQAACSAAFAAGLGTDREAWDDAIQQIRAATSRVLSISSPANDIAEAINEIADGLNYVT